MKLVKRMRTVKEANSRGGIGWRTPFVELEERQFKQKTPLSQEEDHL